MCIKTPLESSVYQLRELRHLKLPALCVWVQIVVLEIGVNNISFVVPLLIGKVFREDIVWLFSTTKIKKKISRTLIHTQKSLLSLLVHARISYVYILINKMTVLFTLGLTKCHFWRLTSLLLRVLNDNDWLFF